MGLEYIPPKPTKAMLERSERLYDSPGANIIRPLYAVTRSELAYKLRNLAHDQKMTISQLARKTESSEQEVLEALDTGEGRPGLLMGLASALGQSMITLPASNKEKHDETPPHMDWRPLARRLLRRRPREH